MVTPAFSAAAVAICTERVEAKSGDGLLSLTVTVAICTERVEAKTVPQILEQTREIKLQSARSVWRQSCGKSSKWTMARVAICTERVEAKCKRGTPC